MTETRRSVLAGLATAAIAAALPGRLDAQSSQEPSGQTQSGQPQGDQSATYEMDEVVDAGHKFFGRTSEGLAEAIESLFSSRGRPNGYILGEEGSGAFVAGLRYGEGVLNTKNAGQHKVFWQGPSIGWDFGGDGARVMMLIYNLPDTEAIYSYFAGANGSAYLIAGAGVSIYGRDNIIVAPIRTGVGARLGVNVGYLKMTRKATWNPF
jgi:hypothetical protein